ncbi:MAG: DNA repair protein RecO [Bacteroidetes bacterium]|nr:MAG: DNA repair protein RecO [Bacteroidota bacterium]
MIVKTKAIVLKNTNYSENSVISKMYTREYGMRTYILQSIRKGKSAIRPSMVQPLSIVQMDVYEKANANINRIKELKNVPLLIEIQENILKRTIALFLVEILNHCITEEQCEEELFDFIEHQILQLENESAPKFVPILFLTELSYHLGVEPQGEFSARTPYFSIDEGVFVAEMSLQTLSPDISNLLSRFLQKKELNRLKINANHKREVLDALIRYYQYHVTKNKKIKSVEILSELLS